MPADPSALDFCRRVAREHYENFPVASWLLPRHLRTHIVAIYTFARTADDFADEGSLGAEERLALLDAYEGQIDALRRGIVPDVPVFIALANAVNTHSLPLQPFYDLLSAFRQDVTKTRYTDSSEIMDYCRRSANPVGRLLLHLFHADSTANRALSDAICTGLQLVNFLQDIEQDYARGRIYISHESMQRFGVSVEHFRTRRADSAWRSMIESEIVRAHSLLREGCPLATALPGRIGIELRFIVAGGLIVLDKLRRRNRSGFAGKTRLARHDWLKALWLAARFA
ncbi:MAG: squalene synthase HpnC [Acidiferrobacterales bacterium]